MERRRGGEEKEREEVSRRGEVIVINRALSL